MTIKSIHLVDEGMVTGTEEAYLETTFQYVAKELDYLRPTTANKAFDIDEDIKNPNNLGAELPVPVSALPENLYGYISGGSLVNNQVDAVQVYSTLQTETLSTSLHETADIVYLNEISAGTTITNIIQGAEAEPGVPADNTAYSSYIQAHANDIWKSVHVYIKSKYNFSFFDASTTINPTLTCVPAFVGEISAGLYSVIPNTYSVPIVTSAIEIDGDQLHLENVYAASVPDPYYGNRFLVQDFFNIEEQKTTEQNKDFSFDTITGDSPVYYYMYTEYDIIDEDGVGALLPYLHAEGEDGEWTATKILEGDIDEGGNGHYIHSDVSDDMPGGVDEPKLIRLQYDDTYTSGDTLSGFVKSAYDAGSAWAVLPVAGTYEATAADMSKIITETALHDLDNITLVSIGGVASVEKLDTGAALAEAWDGAYYKDPDNADKLIYWAGVLPTATPITEVLQLTGTPDIYVEYTYLTTDTPEKIYTKDGYLITAMLDATLVDGISSDIEVIVQDNYIILNTYDVELDVLLQDAVATGINGTADNLNAAKILVSKSSLVTASYLHEWHYWLIGSSRGTTKAGFKNVYRDSTPHSSEQTAFASMKEMYYKLFSTKSFCGEYTKIGDELASFNPVPGLDTEIACYENIPSPKKRTWYNK